MLTRKINYLILIIFFFSLLFFSKPTEALAANYYFDPNGNNTNSGTAENSAWKDFTNVNNKTLLSGDKLFLKRGGIWQQTSTTAVNPNLTLTVNGKGTAANFIEVGAYGTGARPKICGLPLVDKNNLAFIAYRPMRINNASYLKVSSLEVCDGGAGIVFYYTDEGNQAVYLDA